MSVSQSLQHAAYRTLASLQRSPATPLREIRHFLLLQHAAALGIAIHATPLLPALRAAVPQAHITVAASGFSLGVLAGNPLIDSLVPTPNPVSEPFAALRALQALPMRPPFATLTTVGNERSAIALSAWLAGKRSLVGHTLVPELYRQPMRFDFNLSQIQNNLRLIAALGHAPAEHHEPQVFFSAEDLRHAHGLLSPAEPPPACLAVFVTQTSPTQRKSWRAERFIAAAQFLADRYGAAIVFVGTASERSAIEAIRQGVRARTWNTAGHTSLGQLAALLSLCDVGLTLDTGTMHLGRAVGLPMAILAPAWSPPREWLPLDDARFRILKNATLERGTPDYIIDEVSVEEATSALAELLGRYPSGSRQRMASSSR